MRALGKELTQQMGTLGSGALVGLGIRFVQGALLARLLGVAEFGKLASVVAVVAIMSRVNDLGLPGSTGYFLRRRPGSLRPILRIIGSNFAWCCIVAIAAVLVLPRLPLPFAGDLRSSLVLQVSFAAYLALSTPGVILPVLLPALGDYGGYVRLTNLDALFQAVCVITAVIMFGASYQHVLPALAISQGVAIIVYHWYLSRDRQGHPSEAVAMREAYSYGLRLQWGVVMKLMSNRADLLIVGALLPVSQVGLYSVALGIRDLGLIPQSAYGAPFTNLVIDRSRNGGVTDRGPVLAALLLQIGLALVMVLAAAVALPALIPWIYGHEFAEASGPSIVLFTSILFLAPASLCWMTFNAKGRPHLTSLTLTAGGVIGPLLIYALVSHGYGLWGASVAGVLAAALTFTLSIYFLITLQTYRTVDYREAVHRARAILAGMVKQARGLLGN